MTPLVTTRYGLSLAERFVEYTSHAVRDLRRLDPTIRKRIRAAIEALAADAQNLNIQTLAGSRDRLRLRVGEWRVVVRREKRGTQRGFVILRIAHRREIYLP